MPRKATKATGQTADVVARIDAQIQGLITEIDGQIAQLEDKKTALVKLFGTGGAPRRGRPPGSAKAGAGPGQKRKVSQATRAKLKKAKKAYWARIRAEREQAAKAQKG